MNKDQYEDISSRLLQLVADTSYVAHLLKEARCGVLADKILGCCTDAGCAHDKWKKIEPDWNKPDSSDCHTHS